MTNFAGSNWRRHNRIQTGKKHQFIGHIKKEGLVKILFNRILISSKPSMTLTLFHRFQVNAIQPEGGISGRLTILEALLSWISFNRNL